MLLLITQMIEGKHDIKCSSATDRKFVIPIQVKASDVKKNICNSRNST